jgi:hypothetical protein
VANPEKTSNRNLMLVSGGKETRWKVLAVGSQCFMMEKLHHQHRRNSGLNCNDCNNYPTRIPLS